MGGAMKYTGNPFDVIKKPSRLKKHEREMAREMLKEGYSIEAIAKLFKTYPSKVHESLRINDNGKRTYAIDKKDHSKGEPAKLLPDISMFNARIEQAIEVLGEERAFKGIIGKEEVYFLDGNRVPYTRLIEAAGLCKGRAWV